LLTGPRPLGCMAASRISFAVNRPDFAACRERHVESVS
jgi:hypothetical protein